VSFYSCGVSQGWYVLLNGSFFVARFDSKIGLGINSKY
jgi:hypothetical protein